MRSTASPLFQTNPLNQINLHLIRITYHEQETFCSSRCGRSEHSRGLASAQQSNAGVTRAQVRADLVQLEKAGYDPARANGPHYPDDIQAATARLRAADSANQQAATSGYGGVVEQSSQSGHSIAIRSVERSIYFGH
ncbi:DUF4148 domain-containing protein [Paraburkholderia elongata]|uniref:DUF4148 domain-containing protein n=1 Tax=Paraburkholderia elongata TaxID=2675747 RepID=UPI001F2A9AB8|nr:DUF4148 domain-containing protein [Paraburkholderia elongata]